MRLEWKITLTTLVFAIGCSSVARGHEGATKMTIYYVSFSVETLTPITSENIQERGIRCDVSSAEDIATIKSVLHDVTKSESQKFSDKRVRVKRLEPSVAGDQVLAVVEKEGEVRFPDGTEGQLSERDLKTLRKVVEVWCGQ